MITTILAMLAQLVSALGVLKSAGVNVGPIGTEAIAVITATETDLQNFATGQPVVIAHFTEGGAHGTLVALKDGGPGYRSVFGG